MLPGLSHSSQDGHLVVDMANPLLRVVLPVPDFSWGLVVQLCERAMNCKGLYSVLEKDVEHVAQVFAALESSARIDLPNTDPRSPPLSGDCCASDSNAETSHLSAFVPKIIITPPPLPPSTSSLIPYQDSAFHTLLTVPTATHTPFNQSYPPMLPPPPPRRRLAPVPARSVCWTWKNGHWQAALIAGTEPRLRKLKRKKSRMPPVQRSG